MIRNVQNQTLICNQVTLERHGIDQLNFSYFIYNKQLVVWLCLMKLHVGCCLHRTSYGMQMMTVEWTQNETSTK